MLGRSTTAVRPIINFRPKLLPFRPPGRPTAGTSPVQPTVWAATAPDVLWTESGVLWYVSGANSYPLAFMSTNAFYTLFRVNLVSFAAINSPLCSDAYQLTLNMPAVAMLVVPVAAVAIVDALVPAGWTSSGTRLPPGPRTSSKYACSGNNIVISSSEAGACIEAYPYVVVYQDYTNFNAIWATS